MTAPFLPFTRPTLDEATIQGVVEVLRSGWLATGPNVARFEAALSDYVGGRPVRVMTSATAALEIALLAAGIGPGDEVITPAMSFTATANVIVRVGAKPVFVDVDLDSRNIDLGQAEMVWIEIEQPEHGHRRLRIVDPAAVRALRAAEGAVANTVSAVTRPGPQGPGRFLWRRGCQP